MYMHKPQVTGHRGLRVHRAEELGLLYHEQCLHDRQPRQDVALFYRRRQSLLPGHALRTCPAVSRSMHDFHSGYRFSIH